MKKTYTKPEIIFESFALSTNIAGDCEYKPDTQNNYDSCGINISGMTAFGTNLTGCKDFKVDPGNDWNTICYHVPSATNNIFNS